MKKILIFYPVLSNFLDKKKFQNEEMALK